MKYLETLSRYGKMACSPIVSQNLQNFICYLFYFILLFYFTLTFETNLRVWVVVIIIYLVNTQEKVDSCNHYLQREGIAKRKTNQKHERRDCDHWNVLDGHIQQLNTLKYRANESQTWHAVAITIHHSLNYMSLNLYHTISSTLLA